MEEGSFGLFQPGMVRTSAKSPAVLDDDYMELVCENGQILTRGPGRTQKLPSFDQNRVPLQVTDYYQTEYDNILEPKRTNRITENLADTQIVPGHENTDQDARSSSQQHQRIGMQDMVNFSMFLRPLSVLRANNASEAAHGDSKPIESTLIDTGNGLSTRDRQNQQSLDRMELPNAASVVAYAPVSDEQSAAVGRLTRLEEKQNWDAIKSAKPVASSMCSREASNNPTYTLKKKYEETEGSEYQSHNSQEESEDMMTQVPAHISKGTKRRRAAEDHSLSERKRRDKINKKMRALQELIPNSNKVDKVSMLDEAITYMKSLQLQLQMLSMGNGLYTPPMMLPFSMPQMNTLNLAHYPPMGFGMNMGMHSGFGFDPTQYMLGFAGQTMPMAVPRPPFFSVSENSPTQSVPAPSASVRQHLKKSASVPSFNAAMQQNEQ